MNNRIFDASEVRTWLNSGFAGSAENIILSEIQEWPEGLIADFDTPSKMGRITCWLAGFCDFEVLAVEDGRQVYFRHEDEPRITSPILQDAFSEFLAALADK